MRPVVSDAVPIVSPEDIEAVTDPSPTFWIWVWNAFADGTLGIYVAGVVTAYLATDTRSALAYLNDYLAENGNALPHVTVSDLQSGQHKGRFGELASLITGQPRASGNRYLLAGSIGHRWIGELMSGYFARARAGQTISSVQQTRLFESPATAAEDRLSKSAPRDSNRLLASIDGQWRRISTDFDLVRQTGIMGGCVWDGWKRHREKVRRLRSTLGRLCPEALSQLSERCGDTLTDTTALTLLSWAAAVSVYRQSRSRRNRVLFREVTVTDFRHHLNGGQIDALEVRRINGRLPNRRQLKILRVLAAQRFRSVGQLFWRLHRVFNEAVLDVAIIDWKFLVGDLLTSSAVRLSPDIMARPLPSHVRQVERYLTLSLLDFHLVRGAATELWSPRQLRLTGELWYMMPHCQPVVHAIELGPDATRQKFVELIAQRWPVVTERARLRELTNAVSGHLISELNGRNGNGNGKRVAIPNGTASQDAQATLFTDQPTSPTVHTIIAAHQMDYPSVLAGAHEVIRLIGTKSGQPVYEMLYDVLLQVIGLGQVNPSPHFDPEDGGKICCPFPDHQERTPSMQLYVSQFPPRFYCYGCGKFGRINPRSIPPNIVVACRELWKERREHTRRLVHGGLNAHGAAPTEEHYRVVAVAQEILSRALPGSPGEQYIRTVRCLDPDLVHEMKGGYCDDRLIEGLIEAGFNYDQLVFYGFIRLSDKVRPDSFTVQQLVRRGVPIERQFRPCGPRGAKSKILGLPYSAMFGRVTVPLGLSGRGWDNIYGRSINPRADKIQRHRKLTKDYTQVMHGGYHMSALLEPYDEIIVTEGAMDALTLMQMGHRNTMAIIGVANGAIASDLAQSGKNFAAGLDTDATGNEKTILLSAALTQLGWQGGFRNFTQEFFAREGDACKDFNEWWQKCGRRQSGR